MKRIALPASLLLAVAALALPAFAHDKDKQTKHKYEKDCDSFEPVEATIADIQYAYLSARLTPEELVRAYLARIAAYDQAGPQLNSFIHVNERAVKAARYLQSDEFEDKLEYQREEDGDEDEREESEHRRGLPLFGVPIILKDNIDTADMPTTAGSVALGGSIPLKDAFITRKLRRAGAIILGKGSLTEFANFLGLGTPTGYSSQLRLQLYQRGGDLLRVGYGFNPFDPRTDPRPGLNDGRPALQTGGSSSGPSIAVAANLATVGVGTETSGSILSPATQNSLVGIKPTVGLVSRTGIIPITEDQDTAGPVARTVTDAAKLLGVLAGFDPRDPATEACRKSGHRNCYRDYTKFLKRDSLKGARIAVPHFGVWTDSKNNVVLSVEQQKVMNDAIAVLRAQGAKVDDFHDIPTQQELFDFSGCGPLPIPADCSTVLLYGFKRDLNAYLANLGPGANVRTLSDVIEFNNNFKIGDVQVGLKYGQALAIAADSLDTSPDSKDTKRYLSDRARDIDIARTRGLDVVYKDYDAVLFPANRGANVAARAGFPSIVVPAGFVPNPAVAPPPFTPPTPFPAGFDAKDAPFGVTFSGPAFSEPKLIGYAYAYEQATHFRKSPPSTPPLPLPKDCHEE